MKRKKIYLPFILFLLFFWAAYLIRYVYLKEPDYNKKTIEFTNTLQEKEVQLNTLMEKAMGEIKANRDFTKFKNARYYEDEYTNNDIAIIVSRSDSVIYWSTNAIPVEDIAVDTLYISEIFHLSNGWYEIREKRYKDYLVRGAILIKREFRYQNDYLANEFQKDFKIPDNSDIQLFEGEYNIFSSEGYLMCSILYKGNTAFHNILEHVSFVSFILSYIFFISFLFLSLKTAAGKVKRHTLWLILMSFFVILLRYFFFKFRIPDFIYNFDAFGPKYYANSDLLPSLGDLLLNVITVFLISVFLFINFRTHKKLQFSKPIVINGMLAVGLFIMVSVMFLETFNIIKGLIINSSLVFDLNNIFSFDFYSIIGLVIVSIILLSFFMLAFILVETAFFLSNKTIIRYFLYFGISTILVCGFNWCLGLLEWYYLGFVFVLMISIGFYLNKDKLRFTMQAIAFYIVIFSLFSTYCFYEYNTYKEKEKRKLLASQLSVEQDPIAEYLFDDVEQKILADTTIQQIISSSSDDKEAKITDIVQQNYLNGYWSKYNFMVIVCQPGQRLNVKPDNINTDCDSFFQKMITGTGTTTMNQDLFFLNDGSGRNSYLAKIPFYKTSSDSIPFSYLYLELDSKFLDKEMGYPELLIDKNIKINRDLYNYSYAKYNDNQLLLQYGKFYYSLDASSYHLNDKNEFTFFEKDGYDHLFYRIDKSNNLIISKKAESLLYIIAPFSYLFIFYCMSVLVFLFVLHFPMKKKEINMNFKTRIQISMVSVLVVSFVIIGVSTLYYIIGLYDKKNIDSISEKAHSVLIEVEGKLGDVDRVTPDMKDDVADLLTKFSNVFFTDINLYTPGGMLIASSRPQVFDEGMISRKMDTKAMYELSTNRHTLYIHEENIGKLNYISAYVPFRNNNNELIGYINLPYFAKQSELKKEISTFLITFININVILTALAIIIALLVSNYITRPMKLIKDKLGQIKLGRKNEKIGWDRDDEIGGLISEYNRLIDELTESAELLAKSERETAWREMAKQVAHEIKNPLTPMKLGIQYLKKSWEDKTPDWGIRFEKFTKTMIEQIESLSKIASEFSDFAKMPRANNENIDLKNLIESAVILYQDNKQTIDLKSSKEISYIIFADKTQLLRVFNNLIKNSIQAIQDIEHGKVEIEIRENADHILILFTDNGVGITEGQKEKIFSPNFTTKTGGMGLGLAMVKNIIESYNGEIWFESEKGKGTTFFISLPKAENLA